LNVVNAGASYPSRYITWLYFIFVCTTNVVFGIIFPIIPPTAAKTFGKKYGALVFTFIVFGVLCNSVFVLIMITFVMPKIGIYPLLLIGGGF